MMQPDPPILGQTPIDDLSGLRIRSIRSTADLNMAEAENIRKATLKYLASRPSRRAAPFDVVWARRLHAEMFGDVWTWAGSFRKRETNIGSSPALIESDLHNLLADLSAWARSGMPPIEQAARLHHVAVRIHPFPNGNGRWSRLLANIWLKRGGEPPIEWPEATIGAASIIRQDYLNAIRAADRADYSQLLALHRRFAGRR
ncbi:MAG: mobile mystery protein B [Phycisphaeraceae bacterium]|nr:mobile mystery protein B [Phycisphaeraceae bacterium]MBX3405482.1 mobile mystery protein B [Phycisphaeraceae bacterium]